MRHRQNICESCTFKTDQAAGSDRTEFGLKSKGTRAAEMGYSFYDTPDGKDCEKKLFFATKYALGTSIIYSTYDVMFYAHTKGYGPTAARFAYNAFPFVGAAAAFTSIACMGASLRKKDDYWNYIVGGAAAGGVVGAWKNKVSVGMGMATVFALAAVVVKMSVEENWDFYPKTYKAKRDTMLPFAYKKDTSLFQTSIKPQWEAKSD